MSITCRKAALAAADPLSEEKNNGYLLRITQRVFSRALQRRIEARGVSIGMWYFLRALWEEDGLTQRQLSQRVQMMEPTTATALRSMELRRLIRRVRNPDDKRKVNIYLTEEGRRLRDVLMPDAYEVNRLAVEGIDPRDVLTFREVLAAMRQNLCATIPPEDTAPDEG